MSVEDKEVITAILFLERDWCGQDIMDYLKEIELAFPRISFQRGVE